MKHLFYISLLILSFGSSAQKIRFTDSGNQWMTIGSSSDYAPFQHHLSYINDSIVDGINYRQMNDNLNNIYPCGYSGLCTSYFGGSQQFFLIREDTTTGFVYYRNSSLTAIDTDEHTLYNYNLNIGDSIKYGDLTDTVASIDSILIDGVYHKIFNFLNKVYGSNRSYTVLEGVGCTNNPLFPAYFGTCFEYGESLFCFSQNGFYPYIHAPINSCAAFLTACCPLDGSVFDNSTGCGSALSNSNLKKTTAAWSINPNPAKDILLLVASSSFQQGAIIAVYNLTGNRIFRTQEDIPNGCNINTSSWPDGLYMVIIQNNSGIIQKEKIVISH